MNQWNQDCANQKDSQFNRTSPMWFPLSTGPYYALQTTFFSSVCHGGITKNTNAQVTRLDGTTIPGLFAAGEVTTVTNSNGYTISNAITFGRIAAQSASNAQVTRLDGTTIPGLFAAGEVTTVTNSNGYTISNAITFGRIAAQSALKYMNGELVEEVKEEVESNESLFDMSQPLTDGEYEASVEGQEGKMIVKTTITDGKINNVEIVEQHETAGVADAALETLPQAIVEAQLLKQIPLMLMQ